MASPTVVSITESAATADDPTPWTVSRPAGVVGYKTLVILAFDGTTGVTTPSGYTKLGDDIGTSMRWSGFWRDEDGTEGTTLDFASPTDRWAALVYQIAGAAIGIADAFNSNTAAASSTPNPPNLTQTDASKDYLGIVGFMQDGSEADDDTWCTAAPTGYTGLVQKTTGTAGVPGDNVSVAAAQHAFSGLTDGVDNFVTAQSLEYAWFTYGFMQAAGAPGPPLRVVTNPQRW
jgi:hypothetical protein